MTKLSLLISIPCLGLERYDTGGRAIMMGAVQEIRQNFVLAAGANEMIPGPIPFVFDIENDKVLTGHPGERHSDIKGQFTPGGIVEGLYAPNGKMQFRTDTDMPYTVGTWFSCGKRCTQSW